MVGRCAVKRLLQRISEELSIIQVVQEEMERGAPRVLVQLVAVVQEVQREPQLQEILCPRVLRVLLEVPVVQEVQREPTMFLAIIHQREQTV